MTNEKSFQTRIFSTNPLAKNWTHNHFFSLELLGGFGKMSNPFSFFMTISCLFIIRYCFTRVLRPTRLWPSLTQLLYSPGLFTHCQTLSRLSLHRATCVAISVSRTVSVEGCQNLAGVSSTRCLILALSPRNDLPFMLSAGAVTLSVSFTSSVYTALTVRHDD